MGEDETTAKEKTMAQHVPVGSNFTSVDACFDSHRAIRASQTPLTWCDRADQSQ
jgi:hypothetical protein